MCAIGIVFSFLFHIFVKEPDSNNQNNNTNNCENKSDDIWKASVYRMRSHSGDRSNLPSFCAMKRNRPLEDGLNNNNPNEQNKNDNKKWSDWLKTSIFYKVVSFNFKVSISKFLFQSLFCYFNYRVSFI